MKTNMKLLENTRNYRKTPRGVLTNMYQHIKTRAKKYNYPLGFTLEEFHKLFLNDKKYLSIYKKWVKSGHEYYEKPSLDRIDPSMGYVLENIQMMSWKKNRQKGDLEVSIKKHKPVLMLDMDGRLIKRFDSIKEAVLKTGLNQSLIVAVCRGTRNHTGGYKFVYENPELLEAKEI